MMVCDMYTRGQVSFLLRERGQRGGDEGGMRMWFFWEFGVPECILYGSFTFSPNAQWFKLLCLQFVPQVPNKSTLYPICFSQSHPLVNYIASLKENTRLCPFWDWQKLHHSTTLTWLCHVKRFYFRSQPKSVFFFGVVAIQKVPSPNERKSLDHSHTTQLCPARANKF
jgi:hypothetical protein